MRRHESRIIGAFLALTVSACSSLPFSKSHSPDSNQRRIAQDRTAMADQRLRVGQLNDAEVEAKKALQANPQFAPAYGVLGLIEDQRGDEIQAGNYFAKAVQLTPSEGGALNNYGAWLCSSGKAAESLSWFERALADRTYPSPIAALANAGACAVMAGQLQRAERDLRKVLAVDPQNAVALAAMAQVQYDKGSFLQARAFSERRLAAAPASVAVLQLAARIEDKLGDHAAAERYRQRLPAESANVPTAAPASPP